MTDAITYRIATVEDFLTVPVERLPQCLDEFRTWIAMVLAVRELAPEAKIAGSAFEWCDDGEHVGLARLQTPDGATVGTITVQVQP